MAALRTELLELPMTGGLQEHIDARVLPPQGAFLTLQNLVYDKAGAVRPRAGFGALPSAVDTVVPIATAPVATLPPASNLYRYDDTLVAIARPPLETSAGLVGTGYGDYLYVYRPDSSKWLQTDDVPRAAISRRTTARSYSGTLYPDLVVYNGLAFHFWLANVGALRLRVTDAVSGMVVVQDMDIVPQSDLPADYRVCLAGSRIALLVELGSNPAPTNTLKLYVLDAAVPGSMDGSVVVTTTAQLRALGGLAPWTAGGRSFVVLTSTTGGGTTVLLYNVAPATPALQASLGLAAPAGSAVPYPNAIDLACDTTSVHLSYVTEDAGLAYHTTYWRLTIAGSYSFSAVFAPQPVVPAHAAGPGVAGAYGLTTVTTVALRGNGKAIVVDNAGDMLSVYHFNPSTGAEVSLLDVQNCGWLYPMSRPFLANGILYLLAGVPDVFKGMNVPSPPTVVCVALDAQRNFSPVFAFAFYPPQLCAVLARARGSYVAANRLSTVYALGSGRYLADVGVLAVGPTPHAVKNEGVDTYTLDFNASVPAFSSSCVVSSLLCTGGGYAGQYDGATFSENGFVHAPDLLGTLDTGLGAIARGVYGYAFVYEWYDERGNLHQSEPAFGTLDSSATPGATGSHLLTVRLLHLTHRGWRDQGKARPVTVAMYRTEKDSTGPYYRITRPINHETYSPTSEQYAVCAADDGSGIALSADLYDNNSDANLRALGLGLLYTEGGVLPNVAPPAAAAVLGHKGRVWLASAEDDRELWYSKPLTVGHPPEFSDALTFRLDESPDGITALASLDDKLVVFTPSRIYVVQGEGPSATGHGSGFLGPELVASEAGCTEPRSVVTTDQGVYFRSARGLTLLTRGLEVQYVGQPVQDELSSSAVVNSVVLDAARRRITWCLADRVLVYDVEHGAWLTWALSGSAGSRQALVSHVLWQGLVLVATPAAGVHKEGYGASPGRDVGGIFRSSIETPWIHPAGISGFERARRLYVLAKKNATHAIQVDVLTDDNDTGSTQSWTFDAGPSSPMVGLPQMRLEMHIKQQKCSAIRFALTIFPVDVSVVPNGPSVAGLTLELGIKKGGAKVAVGSRGIPTPSF